MRAKFDKLAENLLHPYNLYFSIVVMGCFTQMQEYSIT
ncbi:hypothetical protein pah_c022o279 [Parachlamydia acanthamoebae str. Hall's coccus]|nr:hypothetical protein pah_c022o279 [Parachlamydia acanthamoebae str. Hall's coccus]